MLMIGKLDSYDDFTISCKEEAEGLKHRKLGAYTTGKR